MKNSGITVGDTITLSFTDTTILSSGVARTGSAVVFTDGAVEGDTAEVTVTDIKKNYIKASLGKLLVPSPYRCEPDCPVYGKCGGCGFRHISYEYEKILKKRAVEAAFRRASLSRIPVCDVLSADDGRYRNKAVLHYDSNGKLGYYEPSSKSSVFPTDFDCRLHPSYFADVFALTSSFFADKAEKPTYVYLRSGKSGYIITLGTEDGKITEEIKQFADLITHGSCCPSGIFVGKGSAPEDGEVRHVWGARFVDYEFCSLTVSVSPSAFFQVNHCAAEMLAGKVIEYAAPKKGEVIADLYCGTGILGMAIAKSAPDTRIVGVEINEAAVGNAKENALKNALNNICFFAGDSKDFASHLGTDKLSAAVIDPPRRGCSLEMLSELIRLSPSRIVYVSCNPASLARDLAVLTSNGYSAVQATPVDMFPRTEHVETVVLITKCT